MARAPKPWFREDRNAYFVTARGTRHYLGADKKEADRRFHELMARPDQPASPAPAVPSGSLAVAEVFEKFLDWCQKHRSPRTYKLARKHIQSFCDYLKSARTLPAANLRPFHVVEWSDSNPAWGPNVKRNRIGNVTRAYSWAEKLGYVAANPVRGVEKPGRTKRASQMTPADFTALLGHVRENDPFRDLITFAFEAGCRPQEARLIEARHLKLEHRRIEIPPQEAKGKKRWRVIYRSDAAFAKYWPGESPRQLQRGGNRFSLRIAMDPQARGVLLGQSLPAAGARIGVLSVRFNSQQSGSQSSGCSGIRSSPT